MKKVKVCVLRTAGTNCDKETAFAFSKVGAQAELVHINDLILRENSLLDYQILALPGGFSYGDDIASGKVFANELRYKLEEGLRKFITDGKLIIGICNGFQVLVKSGLLPGTRPYRIGRYAPLRSNNEFEQEASLIINDSGKFEDRWVYLKNSGKSVWTKDMPEIIYLPVAHGEGKFIVKDKSLLNRLKANKQIIFRYCSAQGKPGGYPDNPNGSLDDIAGITDATGRILGLMPHPERHIASIQHPRRFSARNRQAGDGLQIFSNGVKYVKKYL